METKVDPLAKARQFLKKGDPDAAFDVCDEVLKENPNDISALLLSYSILDKARRLTTAYQFAKRAVDLAPNLASAWTNFGRASEQLYQIDDAIKAFDKAFNISTKTHPKALNLSNLAGVYAKIGKWEEAKRIAKQCLEIEPGNYQASGNLGIAQLATGEWKEGWVNYGTLLGSDYRKLVKYRSNDEPEWDGTPGKTVVVYGEQGLGDELSFASMLPDAIERAGRVIVDCDHRLVGLFKRSFPKAKIYGTRWKREVAWDEEDTKPDYSISIGQLGRLFRNSDSDFSGDPYLVPDKERHHIWSEYFKTKGMPVIGIAWSGGLDWTGKRYRRFMLSQLQPLFDSVNAHWVCLQHKDAESEIRSYPHADIHQYKMATLSGDYDDTAGLVSACDLVIGMQTSVCHLAAAMGIETWTFVNSQASQWRYGRDTVPWYSAMKVFKQEPTGRWPIEEAARVLKLRYGTRIAA